MKILPEKYLGLDFGKRRSCGLIPLLSSQLVLMIALLWANNLSGQSSKNETRSLSFLFSLKSEAVQFTTDKLQNVYAVTPEQEIRKFNPLGQLEYSYTNKTLGRISQIDASDPFQILVLYPDFQRVVLLDRTLSPITQVNFLDLGYFTVPVVAMSSDSRLWIFDQEASSLKKISATGQKVLESGDLSLLLGLKLQAVFLAETQQRVIMSVPEKGLFVFDSFGKYLKTIPVRDLIDFQLSDASLHFIENGAWQVLNLKSLLQKTMNLPEGLKTVQKVRIEKDRFYFLENRKISVYTI